MTSSPLDEEIDRRVVPALKTHSMVLGQDGENLFAAGVADMDFAVAPPVQEALKKRLDHPVFGYEALPDALLPALARWQNERHGWQVPLETILRAPNVLNALAMAINLFSAPEDGVIVQPPVFFDFFDVIRENGRTLRANPLRLENGRYQMDFDHLEKLAAEPRTRLLILCNPHNPVGRVWQREELVRLGDICARHDVLVISDEIHGDITFPGHDFTPFASLGPQYADNAIVCLSPAKSFNIAACCSAFTLVANQQRRERFQAENSRLTVNKNNAFANAAMLAAYKRGGPWLDQVLAYLWQNVELVGNALASMPGVQLIEPEGTFLLWLDFRATNLSATELTAFLR
ncbi:MAG TPA: putative C-S lyase, partial [Devosia sp.]|nr:putative C-S lyase [Devosia sp.]